MPVSSGIVTRMFAGLFDIDWSSMHHAYGSAEEVPALLMALGSAKAKERHEALNRFYGAVHHQGDVYRCTTASLPFLFELAVEVAAPDHAPIVVLLVSIGAAPVEQCDVAYIDCAGDFLDYPAAAAAIRERAEVFVASLPRPTFGCVRRRYRGWRCSSMMYTAPWHKCATGVPPSPGWRSACQS